MEPIKLPKEYKYIAIFPSFRCSLNCSYCINDLEDSFNRNVQEISGEDWVLGLNKIDSDIPLSFSGGEPGCHKDFIYILKNLKQELNINILTNLHWKSGLLEQFISEVDPLKIRGSLKYPPIRASYHPEQMGTGVKLLERVLKLKIAGFNVGIEVVNYPSKMQSEAIEQMGIECRNKDISFRVKSFAGVWKGVDDLGNNFHFIYGNYSKYPDSVFQRETKSCLCKTSELIIGPNAQVYRCHHDLYAQENSIGNLLNPNFQIQDDFRSCDKYGNCNPCDVKSKSNSGQQLGHTSVQIKDIK